MDNKISWTDKLSKPIAGFLTSTLFVILVMLAFMFGIVTHLNDVFDSWFLATGFQCVVLIASVNSEILPMVTISKKYDSSAKKYIEKQFPAIALIMSIFMFFFIGISFGAIDAVSEGRWLDFTIALLKALTTSAMELMFSYLFNARWNSDLSRFKLHEESTVKAFSEVAKNFTENEVAHSREQQETLDKIKPIANTEQFMTDARSIIDDNTMQSDDVLSKRRKDAFDFTMQDNTLRSEQSAESNYL